jgi:hypothetical protein
VEEIIRPTQPGKGDAEPRAWLAAPDRDRASIRNVDLRFTQVGDAGVETLARRPNLHTLDLWRCMRVTDAGAEFTDLSLPLNGTPITVTRVYDTKEAGTSKDFGFGWSVGLRDARIRESVSQNGDGFFNSGAAFKDGTKVYLTNPAGERVGFTFRPTTPNTRP